MEIVLGYLVEYALRVTGEERYSGDISSESVSLNVHSVRYIATIRRHSVSLHFEQMCQVYEYTEQH